MNLVLMNMLLAIIMEAYSVEKEKAGTAETLIQQTRSIVRRSREFRKGKRVRLNDILEAFETELLDAEYYGNMKALYQDGTRRLKEDYVVNLVQKNMPRPQAARLLRQAAAKDVKNKMGEEPSEEQMMETISDSLDRMATYDKEVRDDVDYVWNLIRTTT